MMSAFQNCSKFENRTENGKANNPTRHGNIKHTQEQKSDNII